MTGRSQEVCSHELADLSFDSTSPGRGDIKPAEAIERSGSALDGSEQRGAFGGTREDGAIRRWRSSMQTNGPS